MKKASRKLAYFIPPIIVILFLCVTFAVKGVFPFGFTSIANAHASSDLAQLFVPMYTHIWDVLHGDASLFFTFLSGTGICTAGNISFSALLSPLNLLFYFVPRELILESMSLFLMLKTALMSVTAFYFFRKRFDCPVFYSVLFSVLYALSGYVMMYYVHIMWLDSAILLPLLILSAENALNGKKLYPFIIFFTLTLSMNLYIAFMVSLFLLLAGGAYLFLITPKSARPAASLRFITGAITSLLLSAFINIPAALQLLSSKRASLAGGLDGILFNTDFSTFTHKLFVLVGCTLAIILIFRLFRYEKNIKIKWFCAISILVPFLPIIFENINLIWHLGSYFGPANRMGFITVFIILAVCAYSVSKYGDTPERTAKSTPLNLFLIACAALCTAAVLAVFYRLDGDINLILEKPQKLFFILAVTTLAFALILMLKWKKLRYACIAVVNSALIICLCLGFIAVDSQHISPQQSDAFVHDTLSLKSETAADNYSDNALKRIKDADGMLHNNYSYLLSRSALSGWSHSLQLEIQAIARSFGYTRCELRLSDNGGTLFSDALFAFTQTLSKTELDEKLYTFDGSKNGINIYSNNYTLPFSVLTDSTILQTDANYRTDAFEFSNEIYSSLSLDKEPLFNSVKPNAVQTSPSSMKYEILVSSDQVLYFFNSDRLESNPCTIKVNGKSVTVPFYEGDTNTEYPMAYNNGILTLGAFCDELVTVELTFASDSFASALENSSFALMPLAKLEALCDAQYACGDFAEAGFYSLNIKKTVTDENQNMLLIPMYNDSGWSCSVNSQPAEIKTALGGFMCIELDMGENDIQLSFSSNGFKLGAVISLVTLILTLGFVILFKFKPFVIKPFVGNIFTGIFYVSTAAVLFLLYVIPIIITMLFV